MNRVYLDWNATAPLRPEARAAMLSAMDVVGNPSSVHAEGRAAKAIVEKARGQVAALVGCEPNEVVFTSGATEAAAMVLRRSLSGEYGCADTEHDCVLKNVPLLYELGVETEDLEASSRFVLEIDGNGRIKDGQDFSKSRIKVLGSWIKWPSELNAVSAANGEVGVLNDLSRFIGSCWGPILCDITQFLAKLPVPGVFIESNARGIPNIHYLIASAHKIGGPKGVGALFYRGSDQIQISYIDGGGQEHGRRSGTENVIGIAGFGAAAEAAQRDLENGVWDRVTQLRDSFEDRLAAAAPDLHIFGKDVPRLPNTSCFAIPGWKGETQVMQMDLAGYAVSAGSACSSGKVNKASPVLLAMGFDEETASSAIRVSMGPTTTEAEVMGFADTWIEHYRRRKQRAA